MLTNSLPDLQTVIEEARKLEARPLWMSEHIKAPPHPSPRAVPHAWSYAPLRELLLRAGELISAEQADRRVFSLINPGLAPPGTTDTLAGGLQLILPGECAPAHRHSMFALRVIIEGSGAFTSVNSERIWMEPGDVLLTPSWTYHDHGKEGPGPMIWFDGLDVPFFEAVRVAFFEKWPQARYPTVDGAPDSNNRYPWSEMRARLDGQAGPFAVCEYLQRVGGGPLSATVGACAERIDAGVTTPRRRSTASHVYVVLEGEGRTRVGETVLDWRKNDTLAIPAWAPYVHENSGAATAYLFDMNDRPMLENLAIYREE